MRWRKGSEMETSVAGWPWTLGDGLRDSKSVVARQGERYYPYLKR
jgi:hypothetical protein